MSIYDILIDAKKLIENPANWCQGTSARDDIGLATDSLSDTACSWCTIGAIYKVAGANSITEANQGALEFIQEYLKETEDHYSIGVYNDTHLHWEVIQMLETVANRAKEKGA